MPLLSSFKVCKLVVKLSSGYFRIHVVKNEQKYIFLYQVRPQMKPFPQGYRDISNSCIDTLKIKF